MPVPFESAREAMLILSFLDGCGGQQAAHFALAHLSGAVTPREHLYGCVARALKAGREVTPGVLPGVHFEIEREESLMYQVLGTMRAGVWR
jgi:hypothetical protein